MEKMDSNYPNIFIKFDNNNKYEIKRMWDNDGEIEPASYRKSDEPTFWSLYLVDKDGYSTAIEDSQSLDDLVKVAMRCEMSEDLNPTP